MRLYCECGNIHWHDELSTKMVDIEKVREALGIKAKWVSDIKFKEKELRYVVCNCGRKFLIISDPQEAHENKPLCFEEMARVVPDSGPKQWPPDYIQKRLHGVIMHLLKGSKKLGGEATNELALLLAEGGPYTPEQVAETLQQCIEEWSKIQVEKATRLLCSVCGEKQFDTQSGVCCPNGHGGAEGVEVWEGQSGDQLEKTR